MRDSEHEADTSGLDPLENKVERDRAELVGTVEALRARVGSTADGYKQRFSPDAMRDGATNYVLDKVRTHPLQTVGLAAAAAYPVVRTIAKIPAPIMLIGAGVALAGRTGKPQATLDMTVAEGHAEMHDTRFRDPAVTAVGGAQAGARTSVSGAMDAATSRVSEAASDAADAASDLYEGGVQALADARRSVVDGATAAGDTLSEAARDGVNEVLGTIRQRPFVTAGVSLLIGGALAAMLPRSRAEDRLMGETADEARARARAAAREAAESARRIAAAARNEAVDQNLTPEGAR